MDEQKPRVLIVEDHKHNGPLIEEVVERAGAQVILVTNKEAAWAAIKAEEKFDLLVLDNRIPDKEGGELGDYGQEFLKECYEEESLPPYVLANSSSGPKDFQAVIDELEGRGSAGGKEGEPGIKKEVKIKAVRKGDLSEEIPAVLALLLAK